MVDCVDVSARPRDWRAMVLLSVDVIYGRPLYRLSIQKNVSPSQFVVRLRDQWTLTASSSKSRSRR